jgi:hypothetical protein
VRFEVWGGKLLRMFWFLTGLRVESTCLEFRLMGEEGTVEVCDKVL